MYKTMQNLKPKRHGFFGKKGGCSTGLYAGLNVNTRSDDDKACLDNNLQKIANSFGLDKSRLHLLQQGVSAVVEYVIEPSQDEIVADGAVTDKPGVVLCIRTADCVPVLLADYDNGVVGAAHAGWRGALAGVIENTLALMIEKGAKIENIAAAIGPCIGQKSYEVDEAFYQEFIKKDKDYMRFFIKGKNNHYQFDIEGFCFSRLKKAGVDNVSVLEKDTYVLDSEYYSFRRFSHQNLIKKQRCFPTQISCIML